jgi:hypothetical protein
MEIPARKASGFTFHIELTAIFAEAPDRLFHFLLNNDDHLCQAI